MIGFPAAIDFDKRKIDTSAKARKCASRKYLRMILKCVSQQQTGEAGAVHGGGEVNDETCEIPGSYEWERSRDMRSGPLQQPVRTPCFGQLLSCLATRVPVGSSILPHNRKLNGIDGGACPITALL
jgi:hypothetical protein